MELALFMHILIARVPDKICNMCVNYCEYIMQKMSNGLDVSGDNDCTMGVK